MGVDQLTSPNKFVGAGLRCALLLLLAGLLSLLLPASALAAPDTAIDSGPAGATSDDTPTFTFSSDDALATFECRVDGGPGDPFVPCSGPGNSHTQGFTDGPHTFEVRAVDLLSDPDPTPATRSFTVDTNRPNTTIDSGPAGATSDDTPTFTFSSDESEATFECSIDDDETFTACASPRTLGPLPDGSHTFFVRAVDPAFNSDPTPATRSFIVDTNSPDTSVDSGPSGPTADDTPTFTFSSGDPNATFQCRVDGGPFGACTGPASHTTEELPDGAHTFRVRAIDQASNTDPDPAIRAFSVDTTGPPDTIAPDTTITKRPKGKVKTRKAKAKVAVSFTSEAGATFECKFNDGKYRPCDSPYSVKARSEGGAGKKHRISIRATDQAGNVGEPAVVKFKVLLAGPLQESIARRTVIRALNRHGFARRVVKSVQIDCSRRSRYAFGCRFSDRLPGYSMRGRGKVKLGARLSYGFRVKAQGVRFSLTDENEGSRLR